MKLFYQKLKPEHHAGMQQITKMSDNKQVNNSDGKNSPIGYADLLPTELWSSIFLYTEEIDSARLNRVCKIQKYCK